LAANGSALGVTFALYKDQTGGAPLWVETQNVALDNGGHYTVYLGANHAQGVPAELFADGTARWLGVQAAGQAEQPRILLAAVPYAMKAMNTDALGGLPAASYVSSQSSPSDYRALVQTIVEQMKTSGALAPFTATAGATNFSDTTSNQVVSVTQLGTGAGIYATSPNAGGSAAAIYATNTNTTGTAYTVYATGASTSAIPLRGVATAATGPTRGVQGNSASTSGVAGYFDATATSGVTYGVEGVTDSPSGYGLYGIGQVNGMKSIANATTGVTTAFIGTVNSPSGIAAIFNNNAGGPLASFRNSGVQEIGFDASGDVTAAGVVTGKTLVSTVTQGTAPLTVTSTTVVPNLNASLLNGPAGTYATLGANTFSGSQIVSSGNVGINAGSLDFPAPGSTYSITYAGEPILHTCCDGGGSDISLGIAAGNPNPSLNTGAKNTAVGLYALGNVTAGQGNTAVGDYALWYDTSGSYNTAVGEYTGEGNYSNNLTGSYDTFLGYVASTGGQAALTQASAIGAYAQVTASNSMVLGCTPTMNAACSPATSVGIGTTAPAYTLDVHGTGNFTGLVNFASGQTLPGQITAVTAGTDLTGGGASGSVTLNVDTTKVVTGVTAGTDLTGGGTGGALTLNLDTTKVPTLGASSNAFTGSLYVAGDIGIGTTSPSYPLQVEGNSYFSGSIQAMNGGYFADASATALTGNTQEESSTAAGVYGVLVKASSEGATNGGSAAVWGDTNVTGYSAIVGTADSGFAGKFFNHSDTSDTVYLQNDTVATGDILWAQSGHDLNNYCYIETTGDLYCTGTITPSASVLRADDPLDPANKYFSHAAVGSSEMKNMYDGTVTTDGSGLAVVQLPNWFETINTDFRYQLTVIGKFAQAIVAQEIANHQFTIRTDKPNVKVSWLVTAVRQDPWAKAHPLQVEQEKPPQEHGLYMDAGLYGAPREQSIGYQHSLRQRTSSKKPAAEKQPAPAP
jgi:hypothetical protein